MSTCKNCKYWKREEGVMGVCEKIDIDTDNYNELPDSVVVTYCCCGSAMTGENFGCIHFKAIGSYEETQEWFLSYFSKDGAKCEGFELRDGNVYVRMEGNEPYELAYTKGWNETIIKVFNLQN